MPEITTTTTAEPSAEVVALQASVTKLEGALETKKGTVRELKGKLSALESLGDPAEATKAIEFYTKHKDSDPDEVEERYRTLSEQKLKTAEEAHAAAVAKLEGTVLDLTVGGDLSAAIDAAGGVKPQYKALLKKELSGQVARHKVGTKEQTVVLDTDGEPLTVDGSLALVPLAEWVEKTVKPQYPDMFLGANAGGGGSPADSGGDGGGGTGTKTREEWDAMPAAAQSKFSAAGGKLTD